MGGEFGRGREVVELEREDLVELAVQPLDEGVAQLARALHQGQFLKDFHGRYSTDDGAELKNFSRSSRSRDTRQSGRLDSTSAP